MNLSIFQNFTVILDNKPLANILTDIKSGKYRGPVGYIRKCLQENKLESYEKAKKGLLAFTPSGQFHGGRNQDTLKKYSGIIVLDFDKLTPDQLKSCRESVVDDPHTLAAFISPSGNGLKAFVQTNATPESHKDQFLKVQAYYEKLTGLQIDKSGKDYTRLCFMSFDPDTYHNPNAQVFGNTQIDVNPAQQAPLREKSQEYLFPSPKGEGARRADEVKSGADGEVNYLAIYHDTVKFTSQKVSYVTGNRNNFVYQLACNLNRRGVPLSAAMGYILADYNFDDKEVMASVQSAYKSTSEHGITPMTERGLTSNVESVRSPGSLHLEEDDLALNEDELPRKRIPAIDKVENFLLSKYRFRHNTITGCLEFRHMQQISSPLQGRGQERGWGKMNDYIENSMLRELLKNKIKTNLSSLRNLLYSDFCELYNPFQSYFDSLPDWDQQSDHIARLADTITTTQQDLWHVCFRKWVVAMVGCALDENTINQTVIVFTGKQGIGKTTWMEKLVPRELKQYLFSGTINPNNKDTLIHLAECILINLDELENLNRTEIGTLKELITKTHIRIRRAYGHNNETLPRTASFAGSVNTAQFLNDTTGSRRFLSFEVTEIKYEHDVVLADVYAQALHLFKTGFRFWFDSEEIAKINANNEQYQLRSPEEELLLTWFEKCEKEDANAFLTASQILAKLSEKTKISITDSSVNKLGRALIKNKYYRYKSNGKMIYAVRELQWDQVDANNRSFTDDAELEKKEDSVSNPAHLVEIQNDLPF